jgi:NAD(P)-dependent dehydrogenase (short-subunit alcohol dehydrogenase family)
MSSFKIKGNRVVITGGAGGIGSALVKGFIDAGSEVLVSAREASQFESLKEFLTANNSPTSKAVFDPNIFPSNSSFSKCLLSFTFFAISIPSLSLQIKLEI